MKEKRVLFNVVRFDLLLTDKPDSLGGSKPITIDSKLLVKIQSCYWELWIRNSYFLSVVTP